MKLNKNKEGYYSLTGLVDREVWNIVEDMSVAEFEGVETRTFHEIRELVRKVLGKDPENLGVYGE